GRRIWGATSRIHAAEFQDRPGTGIRSREFLRRRIREYLDYRVRARAGPRTAHQEHGEVYSNAEAAKRDHAGNNARNHEARSKHGAGKSQKENGRYEDSHRQTARANEIAPRASRGRPDRHWPRSESGIRPATHVGEIPSRRGRFLSCAE